MEKMVYPPYVTIPNAIHALCMYPSLVDRHWFVGFNVKMYFQKLLYD